MNTTETNLERALFLIENLGHSNNPAHTRKVIASLIREEIAFQAEEEPAPRVKVTPRQPLRVKATPRRTTSTFNGTRHNHDLAPYGRGPKVAGCPRCDELLAGAPRRDWIRH